MHFISPFYSYNQRSSQTLSKSNKNGKLDTTDDICRNHNKFEFNINDTAESQDMMDYMSSLPDFVQLMIITILLILSLILYEAPSNIHEMNVIKFILLRSIAFLGIVLDIYLFFKLTPIANIFPFHSKSDIENNEFEFKIKLDEKYKAYKRLPTIQTAPRCTSAPPIVHTLYPRTSKPINPPFLSPIISTQSTDIIHPSIPSISPQNRRELPVLAISDTSSHESDEDVLNGINITDRYLYNGSTDGRSASVDVTSYGSISRQQQRARNYNRNRVQLTPSSMDIKCGDKVELIRSDWSVIESENDDNHNRKNEIGRRKTTNKERLKVMMRKRREREKLFKKQRKKKRKKRKRKIYRKSTRIELRNKTKLKIVNHYLKNKRKDRNYNASICKSYFVQNMDINCGGVSNIRKWSRNIKIIKNNIKIFGKDKIRNRKRKSWFNKMEDRLKQMIDSKNQRVSNKWIQNKAIQLNKQLYPNRNFKASKGWLSNFKQRQ